MSIIKASVYQVEKFSSISGYKRRPNVPVTETIVEISPSTIQEAITKPKPTLPCIQRSPTPVSPRATSPPRPPTPVLIPDTSQPPPVLQPHIRDREIESPSGSHSVLRQHVTDRESDPRSRPESHHVQWPPLLSGEPQILEVSQTPPSRVSHTVAGLPFPVPLVSHLPTRPYIPPEEDPLLAFQVRNINFFIDKCYWLYEDVDP